MGPFYNYLDTDNNKRNHNNWYNNYSAFIENKYPWFVRGGHYDDSYLSSQFIFWSITGDSFTSGTSRLVLTPQI